MINSGAHPVGSGDTGNEPPHVFAPALRASCCKHDLLPPRKDQAPFLTATHKVTDILSVDIDRSQDGFHLGQHIAQIKRLRTTRISVERGRQTPTKSPSAYRLPSLCSTEHALKLR